MDDAESQLLQMQLQWVRTEGADLLARSHGTMIKVLLGQLVTLAAALFRGIEIQGISLAVVLVASLSAAGAFYSFNVLRHARFLHLLLLNVYPGLWFPRHMHDLRSWAQQERRRVKPEGWEELSCLLGYLCAPVSFFVYFLLSKEALRNILNAWILGYLALSGLVVFVCYWRCSVGAFGADRGDWRDYFDHLGNS